MLYVFQVDTGTMLTFDMNLALESVPVLQSAIHSQNSIPSSSQVLLISGGVPLTSDSRVCSYPAGTDTNPIFLFNKQNIEQNAQFQVQVQSVPINEGLLQIDEDMKPSYGTLATCANKSGLILEVSKEILESSERLIHDQHLQHLGWGAVVANLEDILTMFKKRVEKFESDFWKEFDVTEGGLELDAIECLPATIQSLSTVLIPSGLSSSPNLLYWLNTTTANSSTSILSLPSQYSKSIESLDKGVIEAFLKDTQTVLSKSTQSGMKEIGGLSTRLFTLDQLLQTSKNILKEQIPLQSSIATTTTRANSLSDDSILPDLTLSHLRQLKTMATNLTKLSDISKRIQKAKEELVTNLLTRLKWVILVQMQISDLNKKLSVHVEGLKKYQNLKTVLKQVMISSEVFSSCLNEMGRRRAFEIEYNQELELFKSKFMQVYEKEKETRKNFSSKYSSHFLYCTLFEKLGWTDFTDFTSSFHGDYPNVGIEGGRVFPLDLELVEHEKVVKEIQTNCDLQMDELRQRYEKEIWDLKEKYKNELDAVKSRVRFFQSSPVLVSPKIDFDEDVPPDVLKLSSKLSLHPNGTCKIGDTVLCYYSAKYEAFLVHGNSSVHFLHTDCIGEMRTDFVYVGSLVDKEYCVARRAQNRYRVPQGFHFYRVKVLLNEKFELCK